jgi:hypothetical protein
MRIAAILFLVAGPSAGCSDSAGTPKGDAAPSVDLHLSSDAMSDKGSAVDLYPDLGLPPDFGQSEACESEWKDAILPQTFASSGQVATLELGAGVKQTTVDASAGGMNGASKNPYVYLSLKTGGRIDLDDFAARESLAWDLALRRTKIRVNGGDSGAGQGAVAILSGKSLDQVTAVPASSTFATDDFLDEQCNILRDPINNILTAFDGPTGLWYEYDVGTSKVKPLLAAHVVRLADGGYVKLAIDSYYNASGDSAHFTLRWSPLP